MKLHIFKKRKKNIVLMEPQPTMASIQASLN